MSKFSKLDGNIDVVQESLHEIVMEGFMDSIKSTIKSIAFKLGLIKDDPKEKEELWEESRFKQFSDMLLKDKEFSKDIKAAIKYTEDYLNSLAKVASNDKIKYKINLTPYSEAMKALNSYDCEYNNRKGAKAIWCLNRDVIKEDDNFYPVKFDKYCLIFTGRNAKTLDIVIVIDQWNSESNEKSYNGESITHALKLVPSNSAAK